MLLEFEDESFLRGFRVSGRNDRERTVTTPVEDAARRVRRVKVPWTPITSGRIYRFRTKDVKEESLAIRLDGANYRYLLAQIENADDPPLRFTGAKVTRYVTRVAFRAREEGRLHLYFGNDKAGRPDYDLRHYSGRLRAEAVSPASLLDVEPNPAHGEETKPVPWAERHRWILAIALIGAMAVIGALILRQARGVTRTSREEGKPVEGAD